MLILFSQLATRQEHLTEERLRVRPFTVQGSFSNLALRRLIVLKEFSLFFCLFFSDAMAQACRRVREVNRAGATPTP